MIIRTETKSDYEKVYKLNFRAFGNREMNLHPEYYPRLGFQPARKFGLELKRFEVPDEVFMVYEVEEEALQKINGELKYPRAFFE